MRYLVLYNIKKNKLAFEIRKYIIKSFYSMKNQKVTLLIILSFVLLNCKAQTIQAPDVSPLNVAYLPDNYAHDWSKHEKAIMKVYYSQPKKNDRKIFGSLVPYGKVWRTGANESVEIKVYQDLTFGGKQLPAGTYTLYSVPNEKEWVIIINSVLDHWGAYSYDQAKDVIRVTVPSTTVSKTVESFSIRFNESSGNNAVMRLAWDQTLVEVPISY